MNCHKSKIITSETWFYNLRSRPPVVLLTSYVLGAIHLTILNLILHTYTMVQGLKLFFPKRYDQLLTPGTGEYNFIWK